MGQTETGNLSKDFDEIMGTADPAMIIVTVSAEGDLGGCLVGFHTQTSISPLRYGIWLSKSNRTYELAQRTDLVGIHFLSEEDQALAKLFGGSSGDQIDKFSQVSIDSADPPLLTDLPNRIVARKVTMMDDGGDHACLTVELTSATARKKFTPLRLSQAERISAGHDAEETPRS